MGGGRGSGSKALARTCKVRGSVEQLYLEQRVRAAGSGQRRQAGQQWLLGQRACRHRVERQRQRRRLTLHARAQSRLAVLPAGGGGSNTP